MKVKEFYDYITKHMTPEQALMKLLESAVVQYEHLKFDSQEKAVHPVLIISMAAMDMGWQFAIEPNQPNVRGMVVGTPEYMDAIFKKPKATEVYRPKWLSDSIAKFAIGIYKNLDSKEYPAGEGNGLMHAIKYLRDQADSFHDKDFTIGKCKDFIENFSNK